MAAKALVAFCLLAILLQVRAEFSCYRTLDCDESQTFRVATVLECCVENGVPMSRSHSAFNDSSTCHQCVVYSISDASVGEDGGTVTLQVSLKVGSLDHNVDINYQTQEVEPGTSGVDYTATTGTLTLDSNAIDNQFEIGIIEDDLVEVNETFEVKLEPPNGHVVLYPDFATVTIIDNDGQVTFRLIASSFVAESKESFQYHVSGDRAWGSPMDLRVYTFSDNTTSDYAEENEDYEPFDKIVTLMPGDSLFRSFEARLVDDSYYEQSSEIFYIIVEVPVSFRGKISLPKNNRTVSIGDNDDLEIGFEYVVYSVGEGERSLEFKVVPKNNVQIKVPVSFTLTYAERSALGGKDFIVGDSELQLLPGEPNIYTMTIVDDDETELNETFTLSIETTQSRVDVDSGFNQTVVTIIDNDALKIELRPEQISVDEGRLSPLSVSVHAIGFVPASVILTVSSVPHNKDHYATEGKDYTGFNDTLTLTPGVNRSNSTRVTILDDQVLEFYQEIFEIQMKLAPQSPFKRVTLMSTPRNITILDNEVLEIGFKAVSYDVGEEDGSFTFDVEVKNNVSFVVPIEYTLSVIGGEALRNEDFVVVETPERRLDPGESSVQHTVQIIADNVTETLRETFTLGLDPTPERVRASPSSAQLTATITDDDVVTVGFDEVDVSLFEDTGPVKVCMSIVEGMVAADKDVTLVLQTVSGTASALTDYEPIDRVLITLTKDEPSPCVDVTIYPDDVPEENETLSVTMTSDDPLVDLDTDEIEIIILNDDKEDMNITMHVPDRVNENEGNFTVSLTANRTDKSSVTLRVFTVPNTMESYAQVDEDYTGFNKTFTLMPGQISITITVTVLDDDIMEDLEGLEIQMESAQQEPLDFDVNLIHPLQKIDIQDDDDVQIGFNITSYSAREDIGYMGFGVELKGMVTSAIPITFTVTDVEGNATSGRDYERLSAELTLVPGLTIHHYSLAIFSDYTAETDETFALVLQTEQNRVSILPGFDRVNVTIIDVPELRIGFDQTAYTVTERTSTDLTLSLCMRILNGTIATGHSVVVLLESIDGTATGPEDYVPVSETVTLTNQTTVYCLSVEIKGDKYFEAHDTFSLKLTSNDPSVILDPSETKITIMNDDVLKLDMRATKTAISESKGPLTVQVNASIQVDTHVFVRLFSAPAERTPHATENEDYVGFDTIVPLSLEDKLTFVDAVIIDDKELEDQQEYYLIRMEVPEQPLSDMITTGKDNDEIALLDNERNVLIGFKEVMYTVNEEEGIVVVEVELKFNFTTAKDIPITITVTAESAQNITDFYSPQTVKLNFSPHQEIVQHSINIVTDDLPEDDETFTLSVLDNRGRVSIAPGFNEAVVTITEDVRATVGFNKTMYTVSETDSHVNVCLSVLKGTIASNKNITVMVVSVDGTATASSDYTAVHQTILLTSRTMVSCFDIEIKQDQTLEIDETFKLKLTTNIATVTLQPAETEITIKNDDGATVGFNKTMYTVSETDSHVNVCLGVLDGTLASNKNITVMLESVDGTATASSDYTAVQQTITLSSENKVFCFDVEIMQDPVLEFDETFKLTLTTDTAGVTLNPAETEITIKDDDGVKVGFNKTTYSVSESESPVNVCLSILDGTLASNKNITVMVMSVDGTATASSDYTAVQQTITLSSHNNVFCFDVEIKQDLTLERAETFTLTLTTSIAAVTLDPAETEITIKDDDGATVGFDHTMYTFSESASHANVCVRILDGTLAANKNITVMLVSIDGTATASSDYTAVDQTIVFTAENKVSCVEIEIKQDQTLEMNETFTLNLTSDISIVNLDPAETQITIENDDAVTVGFTVANYMYQESSGQATVTVALTGDTALNLQLLVTGGPSNQSNIGEDRVLFNEMITFTPSDLTAKDVTVGIVDDEIALEDDEIVTVSIRVETPESGVMFGLRTAVVTIVDDDLLSASFSKSNQKVREDFPMVEVCITKSLETIPALEFGLQTRDGSATAGSDYIGLINSMITIPGKENRSCISVEITNDTTLEDTEENFFVDLSYLGPPAGSSLTLDLIETEIIIVDNDGVRVSFTLESYTFNEDDGLAIIGVVLTGDTELDVVVQVEGGILGTDSVEFNQTITFTADGSNHKNASAAISDDIIALEDDELVNVTLEIVHPTTAVSVGMYPTTVVTIVDNEELSAYLENPEDEVNENVTMVEICVLKSHETDKDLAFDLRSHDGTATAGSDYVGLTSSKIDIPKDSQRECLPVQIINDNRLELLEENFFVDLSYSGSEKVTLGQDQTEITIIDEDVVYVSFTTDQYTYAENDGQANVVVLLSGDSDLNIVVSITGGPSSETDIGMDKVVFNGMVTFTPGDSMPKIASATITNDEIALEVDEIVDVAISIVSPMSRVRFRGFPTTVVTIIDDDVLSVRFKEPVVKVNESDGRSDICVQKSHRTITEVALILSTRDGNATEGEDYSLVHNNISIPPTEFDECYSIVEIVNDIEHEGPENFYVDLSYPEESPFTSTEFLIIDDDPPLLMQTCTLSDDLALHPFSRDMESNKSFSISQGCEHTLVKTCEGSSMALEIRVDFLHNNFSSTKVSISFEGEIVIINENLTLEHKADLSRIVTQSDAPDEVVVSIPEIELDVTRNLTDLTITVDDDNLTLSGLCGNLDQKLVFPDCEMALDTKKDLYQFVRSYKIKPSDQILRGERDECGVTGYDTVIHDPLMTVPINVPDFDSDLYLCYEIHGDADKYFNLVSDDCTSVNAHYSAVPSAATMNIIDSISIVAVDNQDNCHEISVDADDCAVTVDGNTLDQMSKRRSIGTYDMNGISIRSYSSRARISAPNCADNTLVMWVICDNKTLLDTRTDVYTDYTSMIKFEITRGLNLHEYSHGLLGQFWNIPVTVELYTEIDGDEYYNVTVSHPRSEPRSFSGFLYFLTWEYEKKECLYVGNQQGGHSPEVPELLDSVIEGFYLDYVVDTAFETKFSYSVFANECPSIA